MERASSAPVIHAPEAPAWLSRVMPWSLRVVTCDTVRVTFYTTRRDRLAEGQRGGYTDGITMLMPRRHLRVDEVAKVTRLSPRTVAGILHGDGRGTSRAVRERVRLVAERLGHPAPPGTRLLLVTSETPYFSFQPQGLFQGLVEGAHAAGCRLEVAMVSDDRLDNEPGLRALIEEHGVDGLLINYHLGFPRALPELLERIGVPAVWINSLHRHDCVMPGDYDAAMTLTRHLIALGHRRIAYADLTSDFTAHVLHHSCLERLDGYKHAMQEADLPACLIGVELPLERDEREAVVRTTLADAAAPTAVIGYCPRSVMPFHQIAVSEHHLSIPGGLSLAAFVNEEHETAGVDLTGMTNPWLDVGHAAVTRLVARCAQPGKRFDPLMVPMRLITGATCGRPSASD
jgi:LacI family transcriptional regulator